MMTKDQKEKFVEYGKNLIKDYKIIGVIPLNSIPDKLLQSSRYKFQSEVKLIIAKKNLLKRILEGNKETEKLLDELNGTCAIMLTNSDPFEIYNKFSTNSMKLAAKPNQVAPEDINISEGETSLQPGQGVTELKSAGIDVKIDKGKVVISKSKVLVKKGAQITTPVAKALHTLDIKPFTAILLPSAILYEKLKFGKDALSISKESLTNDMTHAFISAYQLSLESGMVNEYTIKPMLTKAYLEAMELGVSAKIPDSGITEKLLEIAASTANAINADAKAE
jgi:large subunit ribosomal protein L10